MDISKLYETAKKQFKLEDTDPIKFVIPTGSILLDRALSIGGYPSGRIVEIYGPEMSGKTTLGLHAMAEAQKKKYPVGLIDMERAFDEKYAKAIGLKGNPNEDFLYFTPDFGEQAIEIIRFMIGEGVKLIVVDSVSAMTPKAEFIGETGESFMGLQARMMSQALRQITGPAYQNNVIIIFINQIRMKIGIMFGNPETTSGGKALGFYASIRIETRGTGDDIKQNGEQVGKYTRAKIKKNKLGPPNRAVQVPIIYGSGVWSAGEIFDELLSHGAIKQRSSFYYCKDEKLGNGKFNSIEEIEKNRKKYLGVLNEYKKT
jgi:recombination protein RecA